MTSSQGGNRIATFFLTHYGSSKKLPWGKLLFWSIVLVVKGFIYFGDGWNGLRFHVFAKGMLKVVLVFLLIVKTHISRGLLYFLLVILRSEIVENRFFFRGESFNSRSHFKFRHVSGGFQRMFALRLMLVRILKFLDHLLHGINSNFILFFFRRISIEMHLHVFLHRFLHKGLHFDYHFPQNI